MNSFCILIFATLCSSVVLAVPESTTQSSITTKLSDRASSAKVKRQFSFGRPPNYSPYVGDAALDVARRNPDSYAQTINQVDQKDLNGDYNYAYETTNGIKVRQTSYMVGNDRVVVGYYSYIGPDGKIYTTNYRADQNGYRASGSHLPPQDTVQPLPFNPSASGPAPFVSSTPAPFISSTPGPFVSSTPGPFVSPTPFASPSPYNVPSSTPYREPYPFNGEYNPTTASPIVSSSTLAPVASSVAPLSRRPHFPIYVQPTPPFQGYAYNNPRINTPYSVVSQQTPAPFYSPSTQPPINRFSYVTAQSNINSRINHFNSIPSSTSAYVTDDEPVQFKKYIPPIPIVSSTPRPFNSIAPNQGNEILITPKPYFNQPRLPNSLSINENLLPPHLSVGPLNSSPELRNGFRGNVNFINNPPFEFNSQPSVAPLTVTNLNYRKKRDFDKE
ncbi:extensin-2-like [Contarinia nasturtii]|uniref:extensin-2-like n=1 Tax=Contarinia nasturtii TaxID=265458 RepID=UPI0012D45372|nr:extensin-2-like [Contarinia nasturtii]